MKNIKTQTAQAITHLQRLRLLFVTLILIPRRQLSDYDVAYLKVVSTILNRSKTLAVLKNIYWTQPF